MVLRKKPAEPLPIYAATLRQACGLEHAVRTAS